MTEEQIWHQPDHEYFTYSIGRWNVSLARAIVQTQARPLIAIKVERWYPLVADEKFRNIGTGELYAEFKDIPEGVQYEAIEHTVKIDPTAEVDLTQPCIMAPLPSGLGGGHFIIDGWEKIYAAQKAGKDEVNAFWLNALDEKTIRVRPTNDQIIEIAARAAREQARKDLA